MCTKLQALAAVVVATLTVAPLARAADTVETWDAGALDVDFYVGYDSFGAARSAAGISGEIMLGYGIVNRLSAYLGAGLQSDSNLANAEPRIFLGVFGTLIDTSHVDLDLFLDLATSGPQMNSVELVPSVELNIDAAPDLESWGGYVRAGLIGHSHTDAVDPNSGSAAFAVEINPGLYLTVAQGHQVFFEYSMAFHPDPTADERDIEVGGVALGYNVVLSPAIELITELAMDIPQQEDDLTLSLTAGFIATLPGG